MTTLNARLDKPTEKRVLCGVHDCRGELARVEEPEVARRLVWFGPGWEPRTDGVWASTRRAAMKTRRGQLQHYRPGKPTRRHGGWRNGGELSGWLPYNLPVQAKCPVCGQVQPLTLGCSTSRLTRLISVDPFQTRGHGIGEEQATCLDVSTPRRSITLDPIIALCYEVRS